MNHNIAFLIRHSLFASFAGILAGLVCVLFCIATQFADNFWNANQHLIFFLPLTGVVVVFMYDKMRPNEAENLTIESLFSFANGDGAMGTTLAPRIFISNFLTYLTGGSVGRVGPSLQIGGVVSAASGVMLVRASQSIRKRFFKRQEAKAETNGMHDYLRPTADARDADDSKSDPATENGKRHGGSANLQPYGFCDLFIACGFSAGFTAILNSPLAGAVFGFEVLVRLPQRYMIPCFLSSFGTWTIALILDIPYRSLKMEDGAFALDIETLWKIAFIAIASTLLFRLYLLSRQAIAHVLAFLFRNPYICALAGTSVVLLGTVWLGNGSFNGIGFSAVARAVNGDAEPFDFLWKLLLTCFTLGAGIRGGEIGPVIFIGATFGCAAGTIVGIDPGLAAAVSLVGMLGSATNTSIAVFIFGCESLSRSPSAILCFAISAAIAHVFSGRSGIFPGQPVERQRLKF